MRRRMTAIVATVAALGLAASAYAASGHHHARAADASRLDDGKDLLPQATITEQQAIAAARSAASGVLNEVDLEHLGGRLVFNVDVGDSDVKVDAADGHVVAVGHDD